MMTHRRQCVIEVRVKSNARCSEHLACGREPVSNQARDDR